MPGAHFRAIETRGVARRRQAGENAAQEQQERNAPPWGETGNEFWAAVVAAIAVRNILHLQPLFVSSRPSALITVIPLKRGIYPLVRH